MWLCFAFPSDISLLHYWYIYIIQKRFWNNFKEVHKKISSANLNEEAKRDVKEFIINKELISKISVAFIEKNKEWMD